MKFSKTQLGSKGDKDNGSSNPYSNQAMSQRNISPNGFSKSRYSQTHMEKTSNQFAKKDSDQMIKKNSWSSQDPKRKVKAMNLNINSSKNKKNVDTFFKDIVNSNDQGNLNNEKPKDKDRIYKVYENEKKLPAKSESINSQLKNMSTNNMFTLNLSKRNNNTSNENRGEENEVHDKKKDIVEKFNNSMRCFNAYSKSKGRIDRSNKSETNNFLYNIKNDSKKRLNTMENSGDSPRNTKQSFGSNIALKNKRANNKNPIFKKNENKIDAKDKQAKSNIYNLANRNFKSKNCFYNTEKQKDEESKQGLLKENNNMLNISNPAKNKQMINTFETTNASSNENGKETTKSAKYDSILENLKIKCRTVKNNLDITEKDTDNKGFKRNLMQSTSKVQIFSNNINMKVRNASPGLENKNSILGNQGFLTHKSVDLSEFLYTQQYDPKDAQKNNDKKTSEDKVVPNNISDIKYYNKKYQESLSTKSNTQKQGRASHAKVNLKIDPEAIKNHSQSTEPTRPMAFSSSTKSNSRSNRNNYIEKLLGGIGTYSVSLNSFTPKVVATSHRLAESKTNKDDKMTAENSNKDSLQTMEGIKKLQYNAAKAKKKNNNIGQFFSNESERTNSKEITVQKTEKDKNNLYNSAPDMAAVMSQAKKDSLDNDLDDNEQDIESNELIELENDEKSNDPDEKINQAQIVTQANTNQIKYDISQDQNSHFNTNTVSQKNDTVEPINEAFCQYYFNEVRQSYFNLSTNYFANLYRDHFFQSYQAYLIFKSATQPPIEEVKKRNVILPDPKGKKTLIFDLDETLIHCTDAQKTKGEVSLQIVFPNGESIIAGINIRPFAKYALEELSKYYQIVIFTASHSCYANKVIDHLDPEGKYVTKRLFRENCIFLPQGVFTKDLRIFGNRNLSDLMLIDNSPHTYVFHKTNGVPIIPFYDNYDDKELLKLIAYCKNIQHSEDLRTTQNESFKADKMMANIDSFELIKSNVLK